MSKSNEILQNGNRTISSCEQNLWIFLSELFVAWHPNKNYPIRTTYRHVHWTCVSRTTTGHTWRSVSWPPSASSSSSPPRPASSGGRRPRASSSPAPPWPSCRRRARAASWRRLPPSAPCGPAPRPHARCSGHSTFRQSDSNRVFTDEERRRIMT